MAQKPRLYLSSSIGLPADLEEERSAFVVSTTQHPSNCVDPVLPDNPFSVPPGDNPFAIPPGDNPFSFSAEGTGPFTFFGAGDWSCSFCTLANPSYATECENGCGPKAGQPVSAPPPQPGLRASTGLRSSFAGLRASTGNDGLRSSFIGWFCLVCSAQNSDGVAACEICGTPAGMLEPPPTPQIFDQSYVNPDLGGADSGAPPLQSYIHELIFKIADQIVETTGPDNRDYQTIIEVAASFKKTVEPEPATSQPEASASSEASSSSASTSSPNAIAGDDDEADAGRIDPSQLLSSTFVDFDALLSSAGEPMIRDRFPTLSAVHTPHGRIAQLYVTQQRGGSSCCGYHAFFNAIQTSSACVALRKGKYQLARRFLCRLNQNASFVRFYDKSKETLREHANSIQETSWIWTTDIIDSGLLERSYATYLIHCPDHLSKQLGGRASFTPLSDFHEVALKSFVNPLTTLSQVNHVFEKFRTAESMTHSFFIGALNHWVTLTINKVGDRFEMFFLDSRNLSILGADDDRLRLVATEALGTRANEPDKLQRFVMSLKQTLYQVEFFWQCATGQKVFLSECIAHSIEGFLEELERVHEARLQAARQPSGAASTEPWECAACTFINLEQFDKCEACESNAPAPPLQELTQDQLLEIHRQSLLEWLDVSPVAIAEKELVPRIRALLPWLQAPARARLQRWVEETEPALQALEHQVLDDQVEALKQPADEASSSSSTTAPRFSKAQRKSLLRLKGVANTVSALLRMSSDELLVSADRLTLITSFSESTV